MPSAVPAVSLVFARWLTRTRPPAPAIRITVAAAVSHRRCAGTDAESLRWSRGLERSGWSVASTMSSKTERIASSSSLADTEGVGEVIAMPFEDGFGRGPDGDGPCRARSAECQRHRVRCGPPNRRGTRQRAATCSVKQPHGARRRRCPVRRHSGAERREGFVATDVPDHDEVCAPGSTPPGTEMTSDD